MASKRILFLGGEVKTPPFSAEARKETGDLLRLLQSGESLSMPHSRPMPSIAPGCHELRIRDEDRYWRIVFYLDDIAIVILDVFPKKTEKTPDNKIALCKDRLARYLREKG